MDSIMVFGGGELQLSLIRTINRMGYISIVIDPDRSAIANGIADFFYRVPRDDFDKTVDIAKKHAVQAIVTAATDNPIPMMARVAKKLNLIFPTLNSVANVLSKSDFKRIMMGNGILCAKGHTFHINEKPAELDLNYPVIVKPNKNSGSRGVIKCVTLEEVLNSLLKITPFCKDGYYLVEEYIEGDEISVEAFVHKGRIHIIQVTDKETGLPPYNVEISHRQPSKYLERVDEVSAILQKVVDVTGLDNCAIHPEMKINSRGVFIIEIGPRLGGDFITSDLVPLSTGINMEENLIRISTGSNLDLHRENRASMIKYLALPPDTLIEDDLNEQMIRELSPAITKCCIYLHPGDISRSVTSSLNRHGYWISEGDSVSELVQINREIEREIIRRVASKKKGGNYDSKSHWPLL